MGVFFSCLPLLGAIRLGICLAKPGAAQAVRPLADLDVGLPGFGVVVTSSDRDIGREGFRVAVAKIATSSHAMVEAAEINIDIGNFGDRIDFSEFAILGAADKRILFAAEPISLEGDSSIRLRRISADPNPAGEIKNYGIRASFRGAERFSIWAQMPPRPESIEQAGLVLTSGEAKGVIWGTWRTAAVGTPNSRWSMLRYVWDDGAWPLMVTLFATIALFAAAGWCSFVAIYPRFSGTGAEIGGTSPVIIFATALAVTLAYVVFCPPFHAPDEPDHLLTLTKAAGTQQVEASALELARKGWFESIKFRPNVSFATEFMGTPEKLGWAKHIADIGDLNLRSPLAAKTWPILGRSLDRFSGADALLLLRLINAAMFVGAFAIFLWAVPSGHRESLGLLLLTMPALPFFAMHWSNHAMAVAGMVASSGLTARLILGGSLPLAAYAIWGGLCGLSFLSGVTGIAVPFFSTGIAFVALFVRERPAFAAGAASLFSASMLGVVALIAPPEYFELIAQRVVKTFPAATGWVTVGNLKLWLGGAIATTIGISASFRVLIDGASGRLDSFARSTKVTIAVVRSPILRRFAAVQLMIWAVFFLVPVWPFRLELQNIESTSGPVLEMWKYGLKAVATFFSGFGLVSRDFLTSDSFWGGFGWLDAVPSARILQPVKAIPGIGVSLILFQAFRGKALKTWVWLQYATLLTAVCVFAFAAGSLQIPANLHGRYLVAPFLFFVTVSGIGISMAVASFEDIWRKVARQLMFVAVICLHLVCIRHLVLRYFGSP
jgi:hypothetical protein